MQELKFLHQTLWNDGHSKWQILWALNPPTTAPTQVNKDPASVAFLLFAGATFNRIS
jgi:hypothetical protein